MSATQAVDPFLTLNDILEITKVDHSTIYRWIKDGLFPAGIKLGRGCTRWRQSAIIAWQESLEAKAS